MARLGRVCNKCDKLQSVMWTGCSTCDYDDKEKVMAKADELYKELNAARRKDVDKIAQLILTQLQGTS